MTGDSFLSRLQLRGSFKSRLDSRTTGESSPPMTPVTVQLNIVHMGYEHAYHHIHTMIVLAMTLYVGLASACPNKL